MAKNKAQKIANDAVKKAGGRRILGGPNRFSAVKAVKQEKKNQDK